MSHYRPSPTVATSIIPMYMRGFPAPHHLGQSDVIDTTSYDITGDLISPSISSDPYSDLLPSWQMPSTSIPIDTTMVDASGNLIAPSSAAPASSAYSVSPQVQQQQQAAAVSMYQNAVAAGTMTQAQANSAIAQLATGATAVAKAAAGVATAPSPRVALPAVAATPSILTQSTIIPGIPDIALLGGAGLLLVAMMGKH
jgi:hypothetical protein